MLRSESTRAKIILLAQGISRYNISKNKVMEIAVSLPSLDEQKMIGQYFSQLDNLITLHQRKCANLCSPSQVVFSLLFATSTFSWEQRKLSEITDKVTEKNAGLQYVETFTNSAEFGIISQRDFFDHDIAKLGSLDGYYIVKNEDFVYNPRISTSAPVGPINRNKLGRTGVMSPLYTVFRPHDIDTTYLEYFFKCGYWHSFMNFNGDSGARSDRFSIRDNVFFQMPIPIPDIDEQRKIGELLTCLDNLITLHQRECISFTGRADRLILTANKKRTTSSWEQRKFEEIAVRSSVICSDDTLPRVEYEDIVSGTGRLNKDIYAKQSIKSGIAFHQGDVLYGKLRPYLQNWLLPTFDGLAVGDFWVLQPQNADSSFLYRLIQSRQFDEVANQSTGTKMPRADWKLVSKTVFSIPSNISEQAAIGTYFTALDSLITLHQRKFEKLTNVKKSMLEKMFPQNGSSYPEIRFKGFTDPWEQRKVGDLLIERNQQAPMSDEYPLMAFIANEGVAPKGERYDRSALVTDTVNKLYKKTEKGDFIYSSNNLETGSIGLNKYGKACISPVYSIFEPTGIADSDFLGRRLVRKDFINAMVKWRQGVIYGQWRIHESDFLKIEITVPSVEEQRKIGTYLDQLDHLITLHQRELEKLQNIKKSMLEKMFV